MGKISKSRLAKELGVSRGMLYYQRKRPKKNEETRRLIELVMMRNPGYGHRRVAINLGLNHKKAHRVMKLYGLKPARRAKTPSKPADAGKESKAHPCITTMLCPIVPDYVWVSDFTFIAFHAKFIYLATVVDLYTKEILGASIMIRHTSELVLRALRNALEKTNQSPTWFHSDQGSEYDSEIVFTELTANNIKISMSPKSSPWRNGSQESFFGRFKVEFGDPERFTTLPELMEEIYSYIFYYNYQRIHSKHKMPPSQVRNTFCRIAVVLPM